MNESCSFCLTISVSSGIFESVHVDSYQKGCDLSNVFNLWPFWEAKRALFLLKLDLASWAIPAYTSGLSTELCGTVSLVCTISHLSRAGWQVPIWGPYV